MAEPFAKPTKKDLKKALQLYSDPVLHWASNTAVEVLTRMSQKDWEADYREKWFREWQFLTRRLIWNFGLFQIVGHVYRLAEESADEYWDNFKLPEIKRTKQDRTMISKRWKSG